MLRTSGLPVRGQLYGGWEKGGSGIIGHYLSACAQMECATGDPELKRRVNYLVSEMARAQSANGDGAIYGFENDKQNWFAALSRGEVVPMTVAGWYVEHKYMAGLRDAWLVSGNLQARDVLIKMCDWCVRVTDKLTPQAWEAMFRMGISEFGAPHEILADVYAETGNKKYLDLAKKFRQPNVFDPMLRGDTSPTTGAHANATIAKYLGYERIYEVTGDQDWHTASRNFYNDVVGNRSWATGGNSQWEHFFAPGEEAAKADEICGPETCNTYNILKMTGQMYSLDPQSSTVDFSERALYNSILPSISPDGGFVYYTPQRPGHYRVFSLPKDAFWCCVGTGMENHAKYGEMVYAHSNNRLFVNLFVASELDWRDMGLKLRQDTQFPRADTSSFSLVLAKPQRFTLSVRYPAWVAPDALKLSVNGKGQAITSKPGTYINVSRLWKSGDRVAITLPMRVRVEMMPGKDARAAFFYGPILLAGKLGAHGLTRADFLGGGGVLNPVPGSSAGQLAEKKLPITDFPVVLGASDRAPSNGQLASRLSPVSGQPLQFHLNGTSSAHPVTLAPLYEVDYERYTTYWPVMDAAQLLVRREAEQTQVAWESHQNAEAMRADLEGVTLDRVVIGNAASETAHNLASQGSSSGGKGDDHWRDATGFFSYELKVSPTAPVALRVRYYGGDGGREFDIVVNGHVIATQQLAARRQGKPLFGVYPVPVQLTRGQDKITVRFQPKAGKTAGGVFDLRTIRGVPNTRLLQ